MKRVLFIGAGSIGKRHISNFANHSVNDIVVVDPKIERENEVRELFSKHGSNGSKPRIEFINELPNLETSGQFELGVISTPPKWHLELIETLADQGIPILCEKPLCKDTDDLTTVRRIIEKVRKNNLFNLTAYNYRFCSSLLRLKDFIDGGHIGRVISFRGNFSENVREWHPWDGLNFYMSSLDQGGGALLDESHLLDICRWLFGEPQSVFAINDTRSSLKDENIFETDDLVEVIAEFPESIIGSIHMDLYGKHHNKTLEVVGDEGTAFWFFDNFDLKSNRVEVWKGARETISDVNRTRIPDKMYHSGTEPRNTMYMDLATYVVNATTTGTQTRSDVPDLYDSLKTIEFVRAIRRSAISKRFEEV